eukprot:Polyplicarium_translucidae@DN3342_c3_g1_i3.p1
MIHKSDFAPVASEEPKGNPFHSGRFPSVDSSSSLGLGMALTAAGVDLQKVKPLESLIFDAELDDGLLHTVFASVVDPERYGITRWHIDVSPSFQELATSEGSGIAAIYPIWTGVLKGYVLGQEMLRNFTNSKFKPCPINATAEEVYTTTTNTHTTNTPKKAVRIEENADTCKSFKTQEFVQGPQARRAGQGILTGGPRPRCYTPEPDEDDEITHV